MAAVLVTAACSAPATVCSISPISPAPTVKHSQCPRDRQAENDGIVGANPDPASALHRSEVRIGIDGAAVLSDDRSVATTPTDAPAPKANTDWLGSLELLARVSSHVGSAFIGVNTVADAEGVSLASARGGMAVRRIIDIGRRLRRGVALRVDATYGWDHDADAERPVRTQRPLDAMRFTDGLRTQLVGELRYELLGCYAPFVHVSAGVRSDRAGASTLVDPLHSIVVVPLGITFGAHSDVGDDPWRTMMVFGGYDLHIIEPQAELDIRHRVRFGVEFIGIDLGVPARLGGEGQIDLANELDGVYAGLYVAWLVDWTGAQK